MTSGPCACTYLIRPLDASTRCRSALSLALMGCCASTRARATKDEVLLVGSTHMFGGGLSYPPSQEVVAPEEYARICALAKPLGEPVFFQPYAAGQPLFDPPEAGAQVEAELKKEFPHLKVTIVPDWRRVEVGMGGWYEFLLTVRR